MAQKTALGSSAAVRQVCLLLLCVGLLTLNVGCENSNSDVSTDDQPANSAEAEFEWVMERLERAVGMYSSEPNLGLRVKRDISYELVPPTSTQPNYTASVTIKSNTIYLPDRRVTEEIKASKAEDKVANANPDPLAEDAEEDAISLEEVQKNLARKPLGAESSVHTPDLEVENIYELAYLSGKWKLETKPDSEHEQMWFDYALQR